MQGCNSVSYVTINVIFDEPSREIQFPKLAIHEVLHMVIDYAVIKFFQYYWWRPASLFLVEIFMILQNNLKNDRIISSPQNSLVMKYYTGM